MGNYKSSPGFAGANNIMIFIDGGYLRKNVKNLVDNDDINYQILASFLRDNGRLDTRFAAHVIRIYYYDGIASIKDVNNLNQETEEDMQVIRSAGDMLSVKEQKQEEYVKKIKDLELYEVRLGRHVLSTTGGIENKKNWVWRQKGVDSLIAIDMITKGFEGQYNTAILLAGDADFVEIVNSVKNLGANVVGAFFPDHISQDLEFSLDKKIELREGDLLLQKIIHEN
ncbi:MAG: NYN domain-containing protein [Thaumarchaeota archaeon]|nr:NYN domain-containing protein [Nitrososphaerota archaeon]